MVPIGGDDRAEQQVVPATDRFIPDPHFIVEKAILVALVPHRLAVEAPSTHLQYVGVLIPGLSMSPILMDTWEYIDMQFREPRCSEFFTKGLTVRIVSP